MGFSVSDGCRADSEQAWMVKYQCGDEDDSIAICFTDTTVYFDHLIKTTNPLG